MDLARRITRAVAAIAAALVFAFTAASASEPVVSLQTPRPGRYEIEGRFTVDAATATAWGVITDYDGIDRFVSSMQSSRVLRREPGRTVIEQIGRGHFLFFHKTVELTLDVKEEPGRVEFQKDYGPDFNAYSGSWEIHPFEGGCSVVYRLDAEPAASLGPRFAAKRALKQTAEDLLKQVRQEILRRRKPEL